MTMKKHKLLLVSKNQGKLRELQSLLASLPLEIELMPKDAPEIAETGSTFLANAEIKARALWQPGTFTLADDSGLCVHALGGAPGVHSARFAHQEAGGQAGEPKNDAANIQLLLEKMEAVPEEKRTAHFACVLVLKLPEGRELSCEGRVDGQILRSGRGSDGFGYDPIFYLPQLQKTMAELDLTTKNALSHRGMAFAQLRNVLLALLGENS